MRRRLTCLLAEAERDDLLVNHPYGRNVCVCVRGRICNTPLPSQLLLLLLLHQIPYDLVPGTPAAESHTLDNIVIFRSKHTHARAHAGRINDLCRLADARSGLSRLYQITKAKIAHSPLAAHPERSRVRWRSIWTIRKTTQTCPSPLTGTGT